MWFHLDTSAYVWFCVVSDGTGGYRGYRGYGGYRWCSVVIGGNYLLLVAISSYGWLELIMVTIGYN